jgi:hypothetical protein
MPVSGIDAIDVPELARVQSLVTDWPFAAGTIFRGRCRG